MKHLFKLSFLIIALAFVNKASAQISTATLTVNDTAIAPTSVSATDTQICNGETTTLSVVGGELGSSAGDTTAKWTWYEDACGTGTPIGTGASIDVTPPNTTGAPITKTYYVRSEGAYCGESDCTPFTVTIYPTPDVTPVTDQVKCNNTATDAITFGTSTTGTTLEYSWTNDNTAIGLVASGTGNIASFTATNTTCADIVANIIVTPIVTDGGNSCPGAADTFTITVHPSPNGTIAATPDSVCEGTTAQLTFTSTCGGSPGPYDLEINQDGATTPTIYTDEVSGTAFDITPVPTSGSHTYDLMKITDANGCILE